MPVDCERRERNPRRLVEDCQFTEESSKDFGLLKVQSVNVENWLVPGPEAGGELLYLN